MTIELNENAEQHLLEVKASGKLSADDYHNFEPAVERLIDAARNRGLRSLVGAGRLPRLCTSSLALTTALITLEQLQLANKPRIAPPNLGSVLNDGVAHGFETYPGSLLVLSFRADP